VAEGEPHDIVASRMLEALSDHDLFASAPSWGGKWMIVLLSAAGMPRHALRLRDTDEALRETASEILRPALPSARLESEVHNLVARIGASSSLKPAHRALADATEEYGKWVRARQAAREFAACGPARARDDDAAGLDGASGAGRLQPARDHARRAYAYIVLLRNPARREPRFYATLTSEGSNVSVQ